MYTIRNELRLPILEEAAKYYAEQEKTTTFEPQQVIEV